MEILGIISALLGLVAAILNRKRIIVFRYEDRQYRATSTDRRSPTPIRKRLKRIGLCFLIMFGCGMVATSSSSGGSGLMEFVAAVCMCVAAYQSAAIMITLFFRIWS